MAKLEIPDRWREILGPELKMDVHWIDIKLRDGQVIRSIVVRGGRYITGRQSDPDGVGELDFSIEDIVKIRRSTFIPWPFF